jgi:chromate transporter
MNGLRPAVVGLIGAAVITTFVSVFFPDGEIIDVIKSSSFYEMLVILIATLFMSFKKVHPIIVVLVSALFGIIIGWI